MTRVTPSDAKARRSEVVRATRRGEETVIPVDGEPAVRLVPVEPEPRPLTDAEVATWRALLQSAARVPRPSDPFDAVALVGEARR